MTRSFIWATLAVSNGEIFDIDNETAPQYGVKGKDYKFSSSGIYGSDGNSCEDIWIVVYPSSPMYHEMPER